MCICVHVYMCMYVYMRACVYVHVYMCMCICACICISICICIIRASVRMYVMRVGVIISYLFMSAHVFARAASDGDNWLLHILVNS